MCNMIFIKQRLNDVLIMNESLKLITEFRDSSFVVENDRILVKQGEKTLVDLPYSCVAIMYN